MPAAPSSQALLNAVYTQSAMRRRYEVWFVRLHLADGSGAWWLRYLLFNPGRAGGGGCPGDERLGAPVQVWATWFPRDGAPRSFIEGFPLQELALSAAAASPFHWAVGKNRIGENSCAGVLASGGEQVGWDLHYRSTFGATLTDWGWIGFSRTAHSDAVFSGSLTFEGRTVSGDPLGYGLQGHNCGFRHRHYWNWTHCLLVDPVSGRIITFEALQYEIPFGLRFHKALLWRAGKLHVFKKLEEIRRQRDALLWEFRCHGAEEGAEVHALIEGGGPSRHRLPYVKTDCSGSFEVSNNSLARAQLRFFRPGHPVEEMVTDGGAALEMVGP